MNRQAPRTLKDEIGKRRPFEHPEEEAYLNLLRTTSLLEGAVARLLKSHGLSEAAYNCLRIIRGESQSRAPLAGAGVPTQLIGERAISRVPDVTRLIDRLESRGLVQRSRTREDRRVVLIAITRQGLDLLARIDRPLVTLHRGQLRHMSRAELAQLNRLLVKARQPGTQDESAPGRGAGRTSDPLA